MIYTVRAPGRVNLIGEHTDYSDGFCLPMAIDRECRIEVTPSDGDRIRASSRQLPGEAVVSVTDASVPPDAPRWSRFVAGTVETLVAAGHRVSAADLRIDSSVPAGAGLSSSSALSIALTLALLPPEAPERSDRRGIARLALAAEVAATGVPGGLLDQMASLFGAARHALLLDCRDLSVEPIPMPDDVAVLIVHSGVTRELADSQYAERRRACEAASARLGIPALRDATPEQVASDPFARHVVSENARVLDFAAALRASDPARLGELLLAGHASLRDDYAVSTPELDLLVRTFMEAGAYGARLTGAGFGGCVVALAPATDAIRCLETTRTRYSEASGREPIGFLARPVDGAGRTP